jgi:hypothetical protein
MPLLTRKGPPSSAQDDELNLFAIDDDYTLEDFDQGLTLLATAAEDITITLPEHLPTGFWCNVEQSDDGAIVFDVDGGATLNSRDERDTTNGPFSVVSLYVRSNPDGESAEYVLTGDLADVVVPD